MGEKELLFITQRFGAVLRAYHAWLYAESGPHHPGDGEKALQAFEAIVTAFYDDVGALVDAARHGAEHLTGNWPDAIGRVNASTLRASGNRILRALAALGADDDPDRPLEDDEFQCG